MVDVVVLLERTAEARTTGQPTMRARELHERRAGGAERGLLKSAGTACETESSFVCAKGDPRLSLATSMD
jgi:hypothetical protein